jgi:hypothetical protein
MLFCVKTTITSGNQKFSSTRRPVWNKDVLPPLGVPLVPHSSILLLPAGILRQGIYKQTNIIHIFKIAVMYIKLSKNSAC